MPVKGVGGLPSPAALVADVHGSSPRRTGRAGASGPPRGAPAAFRLEGQRRWEGWRARASGGPSSKGSSNQARRGRPLVRRVKRGAGGRAGGPPRPDARQSPAPLSPSTGPRRGCGACRRSAHGPTLSPTPSPTLHLLLDADGRARRCTCYRTTYHVEVAGRAGAPPTARR
jgi:hypothetical protein